MTTTNDEVAGSGAGAAGQDSGLGVMDVVRCGLGGLLMGLANLVPGISGGTMLLAAGVYERFINAIADLSSLRFRLPAVMVLGVVIVSAALAWLGLAKPAAYLVVHHRWVMYSLFIGLTLGGVPIVWRLLKPATRGAWIGAAVGAAGMAALSIAQMSQPDSAERSGYVFMFLAGVAAASAMILPGVSGGYLLLVLGVYVPLLTAAGELAGGVSALNVSAVLATFPTLVPVGLGVVVGVVVVAKLLRYLLRAHEKPTLGVLLGLLLGAVVGLLPFQRAQTPSVGETLKGRPVISVQPMPEETGHDRAVAVLGDGDIVDVEDWRTALFMPNAVQVFGSLGLIVLGFGATVAIGRLDRPKGR